MNMKQIVKLGLATVIMLAMIAPAMAATTYPNAKISPGGMFVIAETQNGQKVQFSTWTLPVTGLLQTNLVTYPLVNGQPGAKIAIIANKNVTGKGEIDVIRNGTVTEIHPFTVG